MSNTTLAWLAIGATVVPFALLWLVDQIDEPPDWLESEGFEVFIGLFPAVGLFALCPLVASQSGVISDGAIHTSAASLPEVVVSVIGIALAAAIGIALVGIGIGYIGLILVGLPYEFLVRPVVRARRIDKHRGGEFDRDGYRVFRPDGYGIPFYKASDGSPIYLTNCKRIPKVCVGVSDDGRVRWFKRSGEEISAPLGWTSYRLAEGTPAKRSIASRLVPHRLELRPVDLDSYVVSPPMR